MPKSIKLVPKVAGSNATQRDKVDTVRASFKEFDLKNAQLMTLYSTTCKKGCDHCCYGAVIATDLEAKELAKRAEPDKVRAWLSSARASGVLQMPMTAYQYAQQNIPCPMLMCSECTDYAHRPLSCRSLHATTPPEACKQPIAQYLQNSHVTAMALLAQQASEVDLLGCWLARIVLGEEVVSIYRRKLPRS